MNINRYTHYLFRMTNMEDEHKHRYTLLIQDDKKIQNMEDEDKHKYTILIQDGKHGEYKQRT